MLEKAISIAAEAHAGQVDKGGAPYILHPLRVMMTLREEDERVVAVLHDVVEDTSWTIGRLRQAGFPERVLDAIEALTRRPGESYEAFILRAKADPLARRVKLADLHDNSDLTRLRAPTDADEVRQAKYWAAREVLVAP